MASVSFYEELGFIRVGAIACYVQDGSTVENTPVQGYRHWACADESQPEQFGDTSYMMALDLSVHKDSGVASKLAKRLERKWPTVQASERKGKRAAVNEAVVGSSALQVRDCRTTYLLPLFTPICFTYLLLLFTAYSCIHCSLLTYSPLQRSPAHLLAGSLAHLLTDDCSLLTLHCSLLAHRAWLRAGG